MEGIEKQRAGFKFGKYRTRVLKVFGQVEHAGRTYKLMLVETHGTEEGQLFTYVTIRLYNARGRFIKQLMFEPCLALLFGDALKEAGGELEGVGFTQRRQAA